MRDNLDPKQKPWESPYAVFGGNPIWHNDPLGDVVKGNTKEFFSAKNTIDNKVSSFDKKISKAIEKGNEKRIKSLEKAAAPWREMQSDLNSLIESKTEFNFISMSHGNDGIQLSGGSTSYNFDNDEVDIKFFAGNTNTVVHESIHGAGFLKGEWTNYIDNNGAKQEIAADYTDEYKAYRLESIFDPAKFNRAHGDRTIDQIIKTSSSYDEFKATGYQNISINVTAEDIKHLRSTGLKVAVPKK